MDEANKLRIQKQSYLRQHILEPGLDGEAFLEFLKDQKTGGDSIDNWSLNDLETLTDLFVRSLDVPGRFSEYKMQEIDINDNGQLTYTKRIECVAKPVTRLTTNTPKNLVVDAAEKVDGGFFSSNYLVFPVKFSLLDQNGENQSVCTKRKIADFLWLYDYLSREFPLNHLPSFKFTESKISDIEYTHTQRLSFQTFLHQILPNPDFTRSEVLERFLLAGPEPADLQQKKKDIEAKYQTREVFRSSMTRRTLESYPKEALILERLEAPQKHLDLKISNQLREFYKVFNSFDQPYRDSIEQLKNLSLELSAAYNNTCRVYEEMGRVAAELHQTISEAKCELPIGEFEGSEKLLFSLQTFLQLQSNSSARESDITKFVLAGMFSEWDEELRQLAELTKVRNSLSAEYYSFKKDLLERKRLLLSNHAAKECNEFDPIALKFACLMREDPEFANQKFRFLLPDTTKLAKKLADYFGFVNNSAFREWHRFTHLRHRKNVEFLKVYHKKLSEVQETRQLMLGQLSTHLDDATSRLDQQEPSIDWTTRRSPA